VRRCILIAISVLKKTKKSEKELSDRIAREFAAELRRRLGDRIQKIILYGSRARGDFWEGSDFDFLAIVGAKDRDLEEQILDLEVEFLNLYDELLTTQVLSPRDWEVESWSPWGYNIQKEGVAL